MTEVTAALRSEFAPTGTLRVGLNMSNFLLTRTDPASGKPLGVAHDLGEWQSFVTQTLTAARSVASVKTALTIRESKRFHAHDEQGKFKAGDAVRIQECRPMSRLKRWEVLYDAPASKV